MHQGMWKPTNKWMCVRIKTIISQPLNHHQASHVAQWWRIHLPVKRRLKTQFSTPGLGRSPGEENVKPLPYSCLKNPMDRGAWRVTVHGDIKSRAWLSNWTHTHAIMIQKTNLPLLWINFFKKKITVACCGGSSCWECHIPLHAFFPWSVSECTNLLSESTQWKNYSSFAATNNHSLFRIWIVL